MLPVPGSTRRRLEGQASEEILGCIRKFHTLGVLRRDGTQLRPWAKFEENVAAVLTRLSEVEILDITWRANTCKI